MPKLQLSEAAKADLDDIRKFGVEAFGAKQTRMYLAAISKRLTRLRSFPFLGAVDERFDGTVRKFTVQSHIIFYRLEGEVILVARIMHHSMNAERHIS